MCLILFALKKHPKYKFILAANRDEFFSRPTQLADFWDDHQRILGGRDDSSLGTWLGLSKEGRFCAITNFRDPASELKTANSRGLLSKNFLTKTQDVLTFIKDVAIEKDSYSGYNLLLSNDGFETVFHYSNISNTSAKIENGIHGLSNHLLDTPWPKVENGKEMLRETMKSDSIRINDLINILTDSQTAPDGMLPNTGISYDLEKKLSPVFISIKGYGTRCSTAILLDYDNRLSFKEVSYNEKTEVIAEKQYNFVLKA